jgi:transcription elongation factor GreA
MPSSTPASYNAFLDSAAGIRCRRPSKVLKQMPEHIKKKLQEEITLLEHELNHELPAELKRAVALGDLSENAEYHMAKQRQEFVRARLGMMKKRMAELSLINLSNIPRDRAAIGSTLVVFDSTKDEEIVYKLVTSEESDVSQGKVSTTSPIGRSLMGKKVGDVTTVVTPGGNRELEILQLTTMHEAADAAGNEPPANGQK